MNLIKESIRKLTFSTKEIIHMVAATEGDRWKKADYSYDYNGKHPTAGIYLTVKDGRALYGIKQWWGSLSRSGPFAPNSFTVENMYLSTEDIREKIVAVYGSLWETAEFEYHRKNRKIMGVKLISVEEVSFIKKKPTVTKRNGLWYVDIYDCRGNLWESYSYKGFKEAINYLGLYKSTIIPKTEGSDDTKRL